MIYKLIRNKLYSTQFIILTLLQVQEGLDSQARSNQKPFITNSIMLEAINLAKMRKR